MEQENLRFIFEAETRGFEEADRTANNAMSNIGQHFDNVRTGIQNAAQNTQKTLNNITSLVRTSAAQMQNHYNGMSFTRLQSEFMKIEEKILKQEALMRQAKQELEEYAAIYDNIAAKGGNALGADDDKHLIDPAHSANEAAAALRILKEEKEQVATAMVNSAAHSQQMEQMRQQTAQARMGIDAIAFSLATVGRASGGAIEQVLALAMQVRFLKHAFTQTAQTAGTAAATMQAALGGVGIAVMGIMMIINAINNATEESKRKMQELREEAKTLGRDNLSAGKLITEYETLSQKAVKTADDAERMIDIRAELVDTYGFSIAAVDEEGRLLAGNLELMKEQLKVSQKLLVSKLEQNETAEIENYNEALIKYVEILTQLDYWKRHEPDKYREPPGSQGKIAEEQAKGLKAIDSLFQLMVLRISTEGRNVSEKLQENILLIFKKAFLEDQMLFKEAETMVKGLFELAFKIDDGVKQSSLASFQSFRNELISMFASGGEVVDSKAAADYINGILDSVFGDEAQQKAYNRAEQLRKLIWQGLASTEDTEEYDSLINRITDWINNAIDASMSRTEINALRSFREEIKLTAGGLLSMVAAEKTAASSSRDLSSEISTLRTSFDSLNKKASEANGLIEAANILKTSAPDTKEYVKALDYLKEKGYSALVNDIEALIPIIEADAQALAEAVTLENVELQGQGNILVATIENKLQEAADAGDQKAVQTYATLSNWVKMILGLFNQLSVDGAESEFKTFTPRSSGGGRKNKALDREMELLKHKRALDQLTTAEEIANLERILAKYAKTTAEKRKLTEELYSLRKQKAQEDLDFRKAVDQLTLREEITAIDKMITALKVGTEARRELEVRRYEAQKQLDKQEFDLKVYYGQLTLQEQEAQLKQMIAAYKEGVNARIDLEKQLYDVQQSIRQQNIDRLNSLTDAVISALAERYEAQRKNEEDLISASIKAWRDWGAEQVKAIEEQIKALDDLTKEEDRAEEERKRRRKIAVLEQQLQYEQDEYNRRKLQEQLAAAQDDLASWLVRIEREDMKTALREQAETINERMKQEEEALQEQLDANNAYYEELTRQQNLQAEAQRLLMQSSQEEILDLIKAFASDYNITGQSLGEQLVDGFLSRVGDVEVWFATFTEQFTAYQRQLAEMANAAADQFYATHGVPDMRYITSATDAVQVTQPPITIIQNFYGETPGSALENRREIERLIEEMS